MENEFKENIMRNLNILFEIAISTKQHQIIQVKERNQIGLQHKYYVLL